VELALANRPELLQASINVQVTELEVQAQKSRHSLNLRTFASGADLHANPLPAGRYDIEYRPGAIGPEMPPFLSGKQCDRVARASAYVGRAVSLLERTRALITLEVEQAFFRYEEATGKFESLSKGASILRKTADERLDKLSNAGFGDGSVPVLEELLKYSQVLSQMRVQANEARYQQLIALITLERATGAAFRAALSGAPEVAEE
jgi:outer membrane protein TolC